MMYFQVAEQIILILAWSQLPKHTLVFTALFLLLLGLV